MLIHFLQHFSVALYLFFIFVIQLYSLWFPTLLSSGNLKIPLSGHAVKPRKGDALLFFSLHPDATTDTNSLHGSCPVIEGEKWSATKWIHVRSFDKPSKHANNGNCVDEDENCPIWAKNGECEKNRVYMVGSEDSYGYCRKSCKVCSS